MSFILNDKQYFAFFISALRYRGDNLEAEVTMIDSSGQYFRNVIIPKEEIPQVNISFMNRLPIFISFDNDRKEPISFLYAHYSKE